MPPNVASPMPAAAAAAAGPPSASPTPSTPPRDAQKDKLNTLFIGAIAAGVSDDWIETLLKVRDSLHVKSGGGDSLCTHAPCLDMR